MTDRVVPRFKPDRPRHRKPSAKRTGKAPAYLDDLRDMGCCVCGYPGRVTVHHLKATGQRGGAMKSPDWYGLPMCQFPNGEDCHGQIEAQGTKNELAWFRARGIDALKLAADLWAARGNKDAMRCALALHRIAG